jgi:mannose-6-phosphate isomerase-like protein (cupin superfamily)
MHIVDTNTLPGETSRKFEGYHYGDVPVSFFLSETPPGRGPSLHKHPYAEVFVVQVGRLTFIVGDTTIEANAGQIIVVPANTSHKFTNTSSEVAQHVDIHTGSEMATTWLED